MQKSQPFMSNCSCGVLISRVYFKSGFLWLFAANDEIVVKFFFEIYNQRLLRLLRFVISTEFL